MRADYLKARETFYRDWDRMVTFYDFPGEHWRHRRTSNIVESFFFTVRLRTGAAKRFIKVSNATAIIWKVLMVVEKGFRKLNAPLAPTKKSRGYGIFRGPFFI